MESRPRSSSRWEPLAAAFLIAAVALLAADARALLPHARTGDLLVSSWGGDEIVVYGSDGAALRRFTAEGLDGPRGIVVHTGESGLRILVASQHSNQVFVFDGDEQYVDEFHHATLDGPTGMAISESGLLYVSSFDNDSVVVFDLEGTWLRTFSHESLRGPNCVAFDAAGGIHVASGGTGRVLKFDPDEAFLFSYTGGGLSSPMGIARDADDILYVAGGGSNNIVRFDADGKPLDEVPWSHPDLTGPQGLAFDASGALFSSSFYQHQLVSLGTAGEHLRTIEEGELQVPRSLAFLPVPEPASASLGLAALAGLACARRSRSLRR